MFFSKRDASLTSNAWNFPASHGEVFQEKSGDFHMTQVVALLVLVAILVVVAGPMLGKMVKDFASWSLLSKEIQVIMRLPSLLGCPSRRRLGKNG